MEVEQLNTIVSRLADNVVAKALRVLLDYSLCDNCLGRMFALLGRGLSNRDRGRAIKIAIIQALHLLIREEVDWALKLFQRIASNIGEPASKLYQELFGSALQFKPCYICGSRLQDVILEASKAALDQLRGSDARTFVVAAHVPDYILRRENELKLKYKLVYAESIKAELRREVSKLLQHYGYRPDFEAPDVVVNVYFEPFSVAVEYMPLLLRGYYKKLGRRISQSTWLVHDGLKYPYSVEMGVSVLGRQLNGGSVVLHAAGREDVDVRMLGNGRLMVVEVKAARRRGVDLNALESAVRQASGGLVAIKLLGRARRRDVRSIKELAEKHRKVYRALVVTKDPVNDDQLRELEAYFSGRRIRQRTPRRVRHRRADVVRVKTVFSVRTRRLALNVFEALIVAEGGLYIKELVDGDGGDTSPSFAEVLKTQAYCAELDVVYIIHKLGGSVQGEG
jgi:tRNA pseudouridine synthase 10